MARQRIILGAMSGTSADGVDVAVVRVVGRGMGMKATLLGLASQAFAPGLRKRILGMRSEGRAGFADLAGMGRDLTLAYAKAAKKAMAMAKVGPEQVACIAAHGQTLFHAPPLTIQYFDPSLLAIQTACAVVSDFRRADCAVGGQGAPLVPFADYLLFRSKRVNRVLLNIGGIANITYLPAGAALEEVIAFDTGPGNCISDSLVQAKLGRACDIGGRVARRGQADTRAVEAFLSDRYFGRRPPKSTDGPEMLRIFNRIGGLRRLSTEDQLATACLCCARAVARAVRELLPGAAEEIVAAGGGVQNPVIMAMLQQETGLPVRTTAELDVPAEAREAMAFALLGAATLDGVAANVPSVTGASRPVVLGSITPA